LMKRERRRQLRVAVQISVGCRAFGSSVQYKAKTLDLCEGGMAIQFPGPVSERKFSPLLTRVAWYGSEVRYRRRIGLGR
jgi:c-di-GMP-binding flagellar brake protein YcgR